jgi:hypothetical protein
MGGDTMAESDDESKAIRKYLKEPLKESRQLRQRSDELIRRVTELNDQVAKQKKPGKKAN